MGGCLVEGGRSGLVFSGGGGEITIDSDIRSNQTVAGGTGLFIDAGVPNGSFRGEVVGWTRGIDNNSSWDISGARYRNNTTNS